VHHGSGWDADKDLCYSRHTQLIARFLGVLERAKRDRFWPKNSPNFGAVLAWFCLVFPFSLLFSLAERHAVVQALPLAVLHEYGQWAQD